MKRAAPIFLLAVSGCVPWTAGYLSIPLETADGLARPDAVVSVALRELESRIDDFEPQRLAFYGEGRDPVPHRLHDEDGDGAADSAWVAVPVAADGSTRLVVVCPGPESPESAPDGPPDPAVRVLFDKARR